MATKVYGASDDLVEFEGDVYGEEGVNGDNETLFICSDGTLFTAKYGKGEQGIWAIQLIRKGDLYDDMEICVDEDGRPYSDILYFKEGHKWVYAAHEWRKVK